METRCFFFVINERRLFHYRPGIPVGLREVEVCITFFDSVHTSDLVQFILEFLGGGIFNFKNYDINPSAWSDEHCSS